MTDLLLDHNAPPQPAVRRMSWLLAGSTLAFCLIALPPLTLEGYSPAMLIMASLSGGILGGIIIRSVAQGARITVDSSGTLTYFLGRRPNFSLPLQRVQRCSMIRQGLLAGIACDCPLDAIAFHHRKGISLAHMQQQQRRLGYAVVLEHICDEMVLARLRELHATLKPDPAEGSSSTPTAKS